MSILTEEDISQISLSAVTVKDAVDDARAVESAVLAKLAGMELPEPTKYIIGGNEKIESGAETEYAVLVNRIDAGNSDKERTPIYTADQLRQAYAQGAASQLAQAPVGYLAWSNGRACWEDERCAFGSPIFPTFTGDDRISMPVYTLKEAK